MCATSFQLLGVPFQPYFSCIAKITKTVNNPICANNVSNSSRYQTYHNLFDYFEQLAMGQGVGISVFPIQKMCVSSIFTK